MVKIIQSGPQSNPEKDEEFGFVEDNDPPAPVVPVPQKPNIEDVYKIFRDFMVAVMRMQNRSPENPEVRKLQAQVHQKLDTIGIGQHIDWTPRLPETQPAQPKPPH
jgi:hypothetical protein